MITIDRNKNRKQKQEKETESSTDTTDCDNIRIIVTDKTAHTPELGTTCVQLEETQLSLSKEDNPRPGINNFLRVKSTLTVQPRPKATYMRKSTMIPGSPDMNMSPGWLNNRLEQFGGIGSMIGH